MCGQLWKECCVLRGYILKENHLQRCPPPLEEAAHEWPADKGEERDTPGFKGWLRFYNRVLLHSMFFTLRWSKMAAVPRCSREARTTTAGRAWAGASGWAELWPQTSRRTTKTERGKWRGEVVQIPLLSWAPQPFFASFGRKLWWPLPRLARIYVGFYVFLDWLLWVKCLPYSHMRQL